LEEVLVIQVLQAPTQAPIQAETAALQMEAVAAALQAEIRQLLRKPAAAVVAAKAAAAATHRLLSKAVKAVLE
jgi:hypothetical protein